jgi:hypothetical protein
LGLVNQAIVFWQRVAEALPKDQQAKEAISAFQVGTKTQGATRRQGPTAKEQEDLVRQREIQRQEELARQEKLREEEELARQQRMQQEAAVETEGAELEPHVTDGSSGEKTNLPGVSATADSAYQEGYEYDLDESEETHDRKKIDPFSLAIVGIAWLMMVAFVALRWGSILWEQIREHASLAWIGFGVVLLAVAMGLRTQQKR